MRRSVPVSCYLEILEKNEEAAVRALNQSTFAPPFLVTSIFSGLPATKHQSKPAFKAELSLTVMVTGGHPQAGAGSPVCSMSFAIHVDDAQVNLSMQWPEPVP